MRRLPLGLSVLAFAALLTAQEIRFSAALYIPRGSFSLKSETRLVDVGVVVRDDRGRAVRDLTRDDFQLADNGKRHDITAFLVQTFVPAATPTAHPSSVSTPVPPSASPRLKPRFVALVFDDATMDTDAVLYSKAAAHRFLASGLAQNDRVAIFTTTRGLQLQFTADKDALSAAIDRLQFHYLRHESLGCPVLREYEAYIIANQLDPAVLTARAAEYAACDPSLCMRAAACPPARTATKLLADSLWAQIRAQSFDTLQTIQNIVDFLGHQDGSRVMLLASSGFLSGTLEFDQDLIIERGLKANVVINAIDAKGLFVQDAIDARTVVAATQQLLLGTKPKEETNEALNNLSDGTGGLFYHNSNDLDLGFREVGMQPEVSYLLGFVPDAPDGHYHHLKVTLVNHHHEHVQARLGYMAVAAPAAKPQPERAIDREVFSGRDRSDLAVRVIAHPGQLDDGKPGVRLSLVCDVAKMPFRETAGAHFENVRVIAALLDANNTFIAGKEGLVQFALKDATFQRALADGLSLSLSLEAPPGAYHLRTVITDDGDQHIAAATQPLVLK